MNQKDILTAPKVSESLPCGVGYKPLTVGAFNIKRWRQLK